MSVGPERPRSRSTVDKEHVRPYDTRSSRLYRARDDAQPEEEVDPRLKDFIKVSSESNVKAVAGKISHSCRSGDPPGIMTIGARSINQAIKAIAISEKYLQQDGFEVTFQPAFRDADRNQPSIALYLAKQRTSNLRDTGDEDIELQVSSNSNPSVVAGALAARIREDKRACMTAIGVDAVANAVLAVGNTRLYLEDDHLDIRILPQFVHVSKGAQQLSAVKFNVFAERI